MSLGSLSTLQSNYPDILHKGAMLLTIFPCFVTMATRYTATSFILRTITTSSVSKSINYSSVFLSQAKQDAPEKNCPDLRLRHASDPLLSVNKAPFAFSEENEAGSAKRL